MAEQEHSWLNLPGENPKAYEGFREYLRLGPGRTLAQAGANLGKSESMMVSWSAKFNWVQRCTDYDAYLLAAEVDGFAAQLASVRSKHMEITDLALDKLLENLRLLRPGQDPSIRWTQALSVVLKGQKDALTLREEKNGGEGIIERIMSKLERLENE